MATLRKLTKGKSRYVPEATGGVRSSAQFGAADIPATWPPIYSEGTVDRGPKLRWVRRCISFLDRRPAVRLDTLPCGVSSMTSPQRAPSPNPSPQPHVPMRARRRRPRFLWWWACIAFFAGALLWYFTLGSENQGNTEQHHQSNSYSVASVVRPIGNPGAIEIG